MTYKQYPAWIVLLSAAVAIAIYALGAVLLGRLGLVCALIYLAYCAWLEVNVMRKSCVHCAYYGKLCGLGKGWLCARLFPRGDPARFAQHEVSWRDVVPDMLVLVFPLLGGAVGLIREFPWLFLGLLLALVILSVGGNAVIRGSFVCAHCAQRELGCPAQKLFERQS